AGASRGPSGVRVTDSRRMTRVLERAAGDQVVRVQAGVGLDQLAGLLARAGQRLALDPPPGAGPAAGHDSAPGTVGGVLATGVAGPPRPRFGPPRRPATRLAVG